MTISPGFEVVVPRPLDSLLLDLRLVLRGFLVPESDRRAVPSGIDDTGAVGCLLGLAPAMLG